MLERQVLLGGGGPCTEMFGAGVAIERQTSQSATM